MGNNVVLVVLIVCLFGGGVGRWITRQIERKHNRRLEIEKGPQPLCGCGHHRSFHAPATGKCHSAERKLMQSSNDERPDIYAMVECGCHQYSGPEPLTTYYAPEITGGVMRKDLT